jgi:hypothetical protein
MGVFKNSKGSLYTMNVLIIKLVVWLGWLSSVALGQLELSEAVTGFVNFPEVGISCIGNLAVFITSVSKGRLDLEMGARDVLATLRGSKLYDIKNGANLNPVGFTTCEDSKQNRYEKASVVMLSYEKPKPNSSMRQFMEYISNAHNVHSILLFTSAAVDAHPHKSFKCNCNNSNGTCKCIVFENVKEITSLLDSRMPGTVKKLSDSQCLLPSKHCLIRGCHPSTEGDSKEELPPPVSEILVNFDDRIQKEHTCICIPVHGPAGDTWTKLLTTSFRTKDNEERRASAMASDAMENYTAQELKDTRMAGTRGRDNLRKGLIVEFRTPSLILPRLTEILINFLLVGWFRVDGFSTSMVARKAVKNYVLGSKGSGFAANAGSGFAANAFLTTALVKSWNTKSDDINDKDNDTHICQVLTFRGPLLSLRTLSFIAGAVNVLCSIFWVVFIAYEGRVGKLYDIHSMRPSIPRVAVIIVAIGIALGMDCLHLHLHRKAENSMAPSLKPVDAVIVAPSLKPVYAVIVLEIMCIASGSIAAGVLGKRPFKKWVYSALQVLVWVKWGIGSYLLGEIHSNSNSEYNWKGGILVYSSAFFLNFILAAVRCKWKYSP